MIIHWETNKIGPDYPGFAIKHLRNLLSVAGDPKAVFMFAQGCTGNVNGFPLAGGFSAYEVAGLTCRFPSNVG